MAVGALALSCATPRAIERNSYSGSFAEARELLEEADAGDTPKDDLKPKLQNARAVFEAEVTRTYSNQAESRISSGQLSRALSSLQEGLGYCPWSNELQEKHERVQQRLERVRAVENEWRLTELTASASIDLIRALGDDLESIGMDYRESPLLEQHVRTGVERVLAYWTQRIADSIEQAPLPNTEKLYDDLRTFFLTELAEHPAVFGMLGLSHVSALDDSTIPKQTKQSLLAAARALDSDATGIASRPGTGELVEVSRKWVANWFATNAENLFARKPSFDTIALFERIRNEANENLPVKYDNLLSDFHLRYAGMIAGSGHAAFLSMLHTARARQITPALSDTEAEKLDRRAISTISAAGGLSAPLTIVPASGLDPELYDLVRLELGIEIMDRTAEHFRWRLRESRTPASGTHIVIERTTNHIPTMDDLRTVESQYHSHNEQVPNPAKAVVESQLQRARSNLNFAESQYDSAVAAYNSMPSNLALNRVNQARSNYQMAVNNYNSVVDRYNATPSYITRPVYLPYTFREGTVRYGWEIAIRAEGYGRSWQASGSSVVNDRVRIGSRMDDVTADNRGDDPVDFPIGLEQNSRHLSLAISEVVDELDEFVASHVDLQYEANLDEEAVNTLQWLLHPWGPRGDAATTAEVPEWVFAAGTDLRLPDIADAPPAITVPPSPAITSAELSAESLAPVVVRSTVLIGATDESGFGARSSGAIISPDGLILTCAHGLPGRELQVTVIEGPNAGTYDADIVHVNHANDVAVIRARKLRTSEWLPVRTDAPLQRGEPIIAVGNPSLPAGDLAIGGVSEGIVSTPQTQTFGPSRVVADITIASGSSGGPLISLEDGAIVGVVTAVAPAMIAKEDTGRSASGMLCLAAPANKLTEWTGLTVDR